MFKIKIEWVWFNIVFMDVAIIGLRLIVVWRLVVVQVSVNVCA